MIVASKKATEPRILGG